MSYPLLLSVSESNWRLYTLRKADPAFLAFQEKVLMRDQYTCQFCAFQGSLQFSVVNIDGNYRNNRLSNLTTACCFCAQCFFLESVSKDEFSGGTLIHLPEISQNELNALTHVLFAGIVCGGSGTNAQSIYRNLKLRSKWIESELGEGLSNPSWYGRLLIDAKAKNKKELIGYLNQSLRLLPDLNRFCKLVKEYGLIGIDELKQS